MSDIPEIPPEAVSEDSFIEYHLVPVAATDLVRKRLGWLEHEGREPVLPTTDHASHIYDAACALCRMDKPAAVHAVVLSVLTAALPHLRANAEATATIERLERRVREAEALLRRWVRDEDCGCSSCMKNKRATVEAWLRGERSRD